MSDVLVVNAGSSSLKVSVLDAGDRVTAALDLDHWDGRPDHRELADFITGCRGGIAVAGHRVVHGGSRYTGPVLIDDAVLAGIADLTDLAALHQPRALAGIEAVTRMLPGVPAVACFDTAFHTTIPEVASRFPIPREFFDEGLHRYGFHGLSYESIVHQLGATLPARIVIAHLGSGASLCAVKGGRSIDTTMGLTPTGGIPMATRSGDLDPGILLYLMRAKHMDADALEQLLNHNCGLTAISGGESDMRNLETLADGGDRNSQLAIDIFCTAIRKTIAAYTTELSGLDLLIFSGGIGEHSAGVRSRVCAGLNFLGISIDDSAKVRVIPSQEDLQIARHCHRLLHP